MKRIPEISISVNGYDCTGDSRSNPTVADLLAIAKTFRRAAVAILNREHGTVECGNNLASIGVDFGGPYDQEKGLPVITKIKVRKATKNESNGKRFS